MAVPSEDLPATMWAANIKEFHKPYTLEQIPVPKASSLGDHDILIKVAVASYCHTDHMVISGTFHSLPPNTSGSHEPAGTIVALGPVAAQSFSFGDRVIAIGICGPCGTCIDCIGPEEFHLSCKFARGFVGISLPGAFQEYTTIDARFTTKIPDSLSFVDAAPLSCAGATSWRAVKRANVKKGGWLGIVGSGGGLGHLAIQFARIQGINVLGVDARDVGLELSKKVGANAVIDARKGTEAVVKEAKAVIGTREAKGDELCDATICLSDAKVALGTAMAITRCHGTVVEVAQPDKVEFLFGEMIFRDIRLIGSNLSSGQELKDQVEFVGKENVKIHTRVFWGLKSLDNVLELAGSGEVAGKIVVVVDEAQVNVG